MNSTLRLTKGQVYGVIKCLVVDDNKEVRGSVKSILLSLGILGENISDANNLENAQQRLNKHTLFDIVFCDISLGDGLGMDLLRHCRKECFEFEPVFIFISGDISNDNLKEFIELGVRDVLVKPLTTYAMELAIDRCLPKLMLKFASSGKNQVPA
jgi:CheY-like chemotaxis protein